MWPSKRVQSSALMRWEDSTGETRAKVVRRKETRRVATGGRPAQQPRRVTR